MAWGATVPMMAHAVGIELDDITTTWEKWVTDEPIKTAKGVIDPGEVAAINFTINGVYKGETRIQLEHVNRVGPDAAPDWPRGTQDDVYRVEIEGSPSITQETAFRFTDGSGRDAAAAGCLATGLRALNAVPAVNELPPGWVTALDLPLIPGWARSASCAYASARWCQRRRRTRSWWTGPPTNSTEMTTPTRASSASTRNARAMPSGSDDAVATIAVFRPRPTAPPANLAHVDDAAGERRLRLVERGDARGRDRRVERPDPDAEHDHARDELHVVGARVETGQEQHPDGEARRARRHEQLRPQPVVERARRERHRREHAHHREQTGPRLERRVVELLLQELREVEQRGEEDRRHQEHGWPPSALAR